MGIRIRPPREIGILCAGFPIPVVTPKFMYAFFSDLITCPGQQEAPNGQAFMLTQNTTFPCRWRNVGTTGPWDVELIVSPIGIHSDVIMSNGGLFYMIARNAGVVVEYKTYTNNIIACVGGIAGHSGTCFVFWLDIADQQVLDLNLPFDEDGLFLEVFNVNDTSKVHRFANSSFHLNDKILFDH